MPERFQIGIYYLHPRSNGYWEIRWNEPRNRENGPRRRSTGERDFKEAKKALAAFQMLNGRRDKEPIDKSKVAEVLARYDHHHLDGKAGATEQRRLLRLWLDEFKGYTVADLTRVRQMEWIDKMRAKGWSDGYIKRIYGAGAAALNWSFLGNEIAATIPKIRNLPDSKSRKRAFTPEELGALWRANDDERLARFIMLGINTAGRPGVLLKLTRFQIDLVNGLVKLHPPGEAETKKRNAIVPITNTLRPWLLDGSGSLVVGLQKKMIGKAWRAARERAGLDIDLVPYNLRHTVQTIMKDAKVDLECRGKFLGHASSSKMGEWYEDDEWLALQPDYLEDAANAIDAWLDGIDALRKRKGPGSRPILFIRN